METNKELADSEVDDNGDDFATSQYDITNDEDADDDEDNDLEEFDNGDDGMLLELH